MNNRSPLILPGIAAALVLAVVVASGPILMPDSRSYLEGASYRPPLYPLFLWGTRLLFGSAWLSVVPALQGIAVLSGALLLASRLARHLGLGAGAATAALLLLAAPLLPLPLDAWRIANVVMSEALAYAALLFAVAFLVDDLFTGRSLAGAVGLIACAALGALCRPQLLFVYPVVGVYLGYDFVRRRDGRRTGALLLVAALAVAAAAGATQAWQRLRGGEGGSLIGLQLCTAALFISEPSDAGLFAEAPERALVEEVGRLMEERGYFATARLERNLSLADHYASVYNGLLWGTFFPAAGGDVAGAEARARKIWPVLLRRHPGAYLRLVAASFVDRVSLHHLFLWLALLALALPVAREARTALLLAGILLSLSNHLLVSLVEPMLLRYSFYTDYLLAALLLAVLAGTLRRDARAAA